MTPKSLIIGGRYHWRNQPERLVYMGVGTGGSSGWHQFALVSNPNEVWSEVHPNDLHYIIPTEEENPKQ